MTTIEKQSIQEKPRFPWWIYLIEGSAAIVLGTLLLFVPQDAIIILVQVLGIYLLIKGVLALVSIFSHPGHWGWKLIVGLLGIIAGLLILNHPIILGLSASILWVYVMAILAIVIGLVALIQAFTGAGWPSAILGLVTISIGFLTLWQPISLFLALPYLLGLLFIGGGIAALLGALAYFFKENEQKQAMVRTQETMQESELTTTASVDDIDEAGVAPVSEPVIEEILSEEGPQIPEIVDFQEESSDLSMEETVEGSLMTDGEPAISFAEADELGWAVGEEDEEKGTITSTGGGLAAAAILASASEGEADDDEAVSHEDHLEDALLISEASENEMVSSEDQTVSIDEPLIISDQFLETPVEEHVDMQTEFVATEIFDEKEPGSIETTSEMDDTQKRLLDRKIEYMEGIGPVYAEKLGGVGIFSAYDLLQQGATRKGRMEIAEKTGISLKLIMRWTNQADLFRITGVGSEYAELLEAAGVDTVVELATRKPENLHQAMLTTNEEKKLVRQVPSFSQVEKWVSQAKVIPRMIRY